MIKSFKYFAPLAFLFFGCKSLETEAYLFSYFQGNGQDGLHLAYSYDGFHWKALNNNQTFLKPQVGNDQLMRDPCIIRGKDDIYHMVWTVSWNEKGIGHASSKDLINWSEQQYVPVMEHEALARNCWAPEIFYDDKKEIYLIIWSTTISDRFLETANFGDDGYNHRIYSTTTKDFVHFSPTKLFYDDGFNVIDASIVKDEHTYLMFLKDETKKPNPEKNIRTATSKNLLGKYSSASAPFTMHWVEGPTCIKIGKEWILYFDRYMDKKMGAMKSSDLKNWTDISAQVHFPEGTRHGSVVSIPRILLDRILEKQ